MEQASLYVSCVEETNLNIDVLDGSGHLLHIALPPQVHGNFTEAQLRESLRYFLVCPIQKVIWLRNEHRVEALLCTLERESLAYACTYLPVLVLI